MERKAILKVRDLQKKYGLSAESSLVLKGVTVDVYEEDFTVIMGSSGSGKSTFLYCVSGMDSITSGSVLFGDFRLEEMKENQLSMLRRNSMGFVFQQMNLLPSLSLKENIIVPAYLSGKGKNSEILEQAEGLIKSFGIEGIKNHKPNEVSGGQLQRAAIARALINSPNIIYADEPTGALNSSSSEDVLNIMSKCNENGQTILMVTHDVNAALRADRIIYIKDGSIGGEKNFPKYRTDGDKEKRRNAVLDWLSEMGW